jgi:hypothetical protein
LRKVAADYKINPIGIIKKDRFQGKKAATPALFNKSIAVLQQMNKSNRPPADSCSLSSNRTNSIVPKIGFHEMSANIFSKMTPLTP